MEAGPNDETATTATRPAPFTISRDQARAGKDERTEYVDVFEWAPGGRVRVRSLTATERDDFENALQGEKGKKNMQDVRSKFVVKCCIDDDGNRLFADADLSWLKQKSAAVIDRIFNVGSRLSGMGKTDVEAVAQDLKSETVP